MTDTTRPPSSEKGQHVQYALVPNHLSGGPHGLGDPEDRTLRKVEKEITIPKMMKLKAKEKCSDLVKDFVECSKKEGLMMPFRCRKENRVMQECQLKWFQDPSFFEFCKEEYLKERAEYRRTGISQKERRRESATF